MFAITGFFVLMFFSIHFTRITGEKNIVCYTEDFVI